MLLIVSELIFRYYYFLLFSKVFWYSTKSSIGGVISDALTTNYGFYIMAIALFLGAGIGQFLSSFGFFFIDESIKNENLQAD